LTKDDNPEKLNFRFSNSSKDLKQNLEDLFGQLNRMEFITSKEMYDQALGLFQVEIRKAGRGHLVFITDENGNPIRHPVKMSDFQERPKFYLSENHGQRTTTVNSAKSVDSERINVGTSVLQSLVRKEIAKLLCLNKNEFYEKAKKAKLVHKQNKYRRRF
jgi:hypothetical protein